ncbi:unnamed protein product [Trichobilharzia regenti]|nr:unnamed protein product [Trichobilharzia regenti]
MDNQTLSGLVNSSNRQGIIAPNNQLHQDVNQADIRGRPRGPRAPLCERELRRLKHELQVMREQVGVFYVNIDYLQMNVTNLITSNQQFS